VSVGTCDSGYVSNSARYYDGGCIGLNYRSLLSDGSFNLSKISAEASAAGMTTPAQYPAVTAGCVKQGECNVPFIEQMRKWSSTGSHLNQTQVPNVAMDRLLGGVIETYPGACRDIYPYNPEATPLVKLSMAVIVSGTVEDYTADVLSLMTRKVAQTLGRHTSDVSIAASAGSVLLTIEVNYATNATATAGKATISSMVSSNTAAAAMLSTYAMNITVSDMTPTSMLAVGEQMNYVSNNGTLVSIFVSPPAAPPPPSPATPPPEGGLGVGGIVGLAVGISVVVIAILVAVGVMMKKKAANTKVVNAGQ
jgi:hypothetical protein